MSHTLPANPSSSSSPPSPCTLQPELPRQGDLQRQGDPQRQAEFQHLAQLRSEPYVFDLDAGRACLDFANTRGSSPPTSDHLNTYADLVDFAVQANLITRVDGDWLRGEAERDPVTSAGVLTRARRLRESLRTIFSALAAGRKLTEADLGVLNFDLAVSLVHARVVPAGGLNTFRWGWSGRNLDAPVWPISRSAADLLTSDEERGLVRQCGADDCAWLFLDTTRNRSRQWCSMQSCGNREKARRHYQRLRERRGPVGDGAAAASNAEVGRTAAPAEDSGRVSSTARQAKLATKGSRGGASSRRRRAE